MTDFPPPTIEPAWIQQVRDDTAVAYRWVETYMGDECVAARARFIATNMHLQGIDWWTAMDMLRDADAHLDITEPLAERIPHWSPLHAYVTLTLIYSTKAFTAEWDDDMRYMAVRATIENNSRHIR